MEINIRHQCADYESYRAARVKSLFNCEDGHQFSLTADLPIEAEDWSIGLIVGPSGSGKTSIGREIFKSPAFYSPHWPKDKPIIDAIAPRDDFNSVTASLAAVGLGSVPAWLRPFRVLSTGEKFRANLARLVCERPAKVVVDEFTSVVDRQIAQIGAGAFRKAWRRTQGRVVLLSCHYDIIPWVRPDWIFDTKDGSFQRGCLPPRPTFDLEIHQTNWCYWHLFEPHYYLRLPKMVAAFNYVGAVNSDLVAHVAFSTTAGLKEARASRLVIMPEWQGAGFGLRFLCEIAQRWLEGKNHYNKPMTTLFHTSHPGLAMVLRRSLVWHQVSCNLFGANKLRSIKSLNRAARKKGVTAARGGFGGHFRAVQGFRYVGQGGQA